LTGSEFFLDDRNDGDPNSYRFYFLDRTERLQPLR